MSAPAPLPETSPASPWTGVFLSPGPAMQDLIARPRFASALAVLTLISVASMAIARQRGVIDHFLRYRLENDPRLEQVSAAQRERIIEQSAGFLGYLFLAGAFMAPALGALLSGAFFLFVSNLLLGARARFRQLLAIVSHAWLPHALLGLIGIPVLLAKDPDAVDLRNIVPLTNLGLLFDSLEHPKLYAAASGFDLFSFWVIGLLGIGLSRLTRKPKPAVLPFIVAPWLIYVLLIKPLQA